MRLGGADQQTHDYGTVGQRTRKGVPRRLRRGHADTDMELGAEGDEHEPHLHLPRPRRPLLWTGAAGLQPGADARPHGGPAPMAALKSEGKPGEGFQGVLLPALQARHARDGHDEADGHLRGQGDDGGDHPAQPPGALLRIPLLREAQAPRAAAGEMQGIRDSPEGVRQDQGGCGLDADWTLEDGTVIPNSEFTEPSDFVPRKYAYCSDTAYFPEMIPQIKGADLLYHEATFTTEDEQQAVNAAHSTAAQAATIARDARVKKLAIGHYSVRYEKETELLAEAQAVFPNTVASQEGMTICL